jgi:hypothetical protein
MALISSKAEKIADDVLSSNEEILSVSVIDWTGNILAVKSKESFKKRFRVNSLRGVDIVELLLLQPLLWQMK